MRRLSIYIIMFAIFASLFVATPAYRVSAASEGYYVPIYIINNGEADWANYTVMLYIENNGSLTWSFTADSIYFVDADGNPLYYYVEVLNDNYLLAWVRVPSLPAGANVTIYMYYNGTNEHPDYSAPDKVFIFWDDFETWSGWSDYGSGTVTQSGDVAFSGSYSAKKDSNNDPNGATKSLGTSISDNYCLVAWIYRPSSYSGGDADRISLVDANGNGYGFILHHGADEVGYDTRSSYSGTSTYLADLADDPLSTWYFAEFCYSGGNVEVVVRNSDFSVNAAGSASGAAAAAVDTVLIAGGYTYYVDNLRVVAYDPNISYRIGEEKLVQPYSVIVQPGSENVEDYWATKTKVKPVLLASDNETEVKLFTSGGVPYLYIKGWYGPPEEAGYTYYCQSWGGVRTYVPAFPHVKVSLSYLTPANVSVGGDVVQGLSYPLLVLGHGDERVLVARAEIYYWSPSEEAWLQVTLGVYNVEKGEMEWALSLVNLNSTTLDDINTHGVTIEFVPKFYSFTVNSNTTTLVFGWKVYVTYWNGAEKITTTYTVAYETYTAKAPVTYAEVMRYTNDVRGWYVWVGSGLDVYVQGLAVQHCVYVGQTVVSGDDFEYIMKYPLIESWEVDTKKLWDYFVAGKLEEYTAGGQVATEVSIDWAAAWSVGIPWVLGLGIAAVVRKEARAGVPAALGAALVALLGGGALFGWDPALMLIAVVALGLAIYVEYQSE